jgi:hypothetical protein
VQAEDGRCKQNMTRAKNARGVRACAEAIRQDRSKRGSDNKRRGVTVQGNDVPSDDVQGGAMLRVVVFSLGELRPRPSWCAGGSRVMDAGGRRGEGNGRSPAALRTTRGEFGGG